MKQEYMKDTVLIFQTKTNSDLKSLMSPIFKDRKVLLWITLVLTYLRTYIQVIFRRSHPTQKLIKQKMSEILQVNVPIFYFAEIP